MVYLQNCCCSQAMFCLHLNLLAQNQRYLHNFLVISILLWINIDKLCFNFASINQSTYTNRENIVYLKNEIVIGLENIILNCRYSFFHWQNDFVSTAAAADTDGRQPLRRRLFHWGGAVFTSLSLFYLHCDYSLVSIVIVIS